MKESDLEAIRRGKVEVPLQKRNYYRDEPSLDPARGSEDEFNIDETNPIPIPKTSRAQAYRPERKVRMEARPGSSYRPVQGVKKAPKAPKPKSSYRYLMVLLVVFLVTILYTAYLFRGFIGKGPKPEAQSQKNYELVDPTSEGISIE